jgi:Tfp pilus assembly protein PilN
VSPPRDFSTRPSARRLSRAARALLFGGIAAFLLAAWATGDAWGEHRAASARLAQAHAETEAVRARIRELQNRRGGPEQAMAVQAVLTSDASPPRVLAELAELLPGDVRLEAVSLAYGEQVELDLRVAARHPASFDLLLESLQRSPSFSQVLPGDEDRRGDMRATVRARYRVRDL